MPIRDQHSRDVAILQFEVNIQKAVETTFTDHLFDDHIKIHIGDNYRLSIEENLKNYPIDTLDTKSILLYMLQLFVIYYYPKFILQNICTVMVENVTVISQGINALKEGDNYIDKLSELVTSLTNTPTQQEGGVFGLFGSSKGRADYDARHPNPRANPKIVAAELKIAEENLKNKKFALAKEQIKKDVFEKYIKGINLNDQYNIKSRKVFYNALVNFAISITLDITRDK